MVYLKAIQRNYQWTFLCRESSIKERIGKNSEELHPLSPPWIRLGASTCFVVCRMQRIVCWHAPRNFFFLRIFCLLTCSLLLVWIAHYPCWRCNACVQCGLLIFGGLLATQEEAELLRVENKTNGSLKLIRLTCTALPASLTLSRCFWREGPSANVCFIRSIDCFALPHGRLWLLFSQAMFSKELWQC